MEIRHRGVFVFMGVQFLRKRVHRSHFLLKLRFFAKKKEGRTSVRPSFFSRRGSRIEPASIAPAMDIRRLAPSAGLDSRLHFCAPLFLFMAMLPN